MSYII